MTPEPAPASPAPFNGHTALLLRVASVLVPLSLLLAAVSAVGGYFTSRDVSEQNDQLAQVVADLESERETREREACETAVETRAEQEQMWVDLLTRAGADAESIELLHDGYAGLPTPASCE